jgi:CRISPR/Cas system Type II protein with McrA/HNH and RuvC-like nuclease domain
MKWRYKNGLDGKAITSKAQKAVRENGFPTRKGKPASWLVGGNADEIKKKISEAKLKNNWMKGRTGSKHHGWLGGKIWWRGKDWDKVKLKVKERDGFLCVRCGKSEVQNLKETSQPLCVDHIIPYRFSKNNSMDNLQTMCHSCHGKKQPEDRVFFEQL